jgi:Na+-transporting NADH:ubiquinone oxidoreductase subunit B
MMSFLQQCRLAWQAPRVIAIQYQHVASPSGLCLRRSAGVDGLNWRLAVAALPLLSVWLWNSGLQLRSLALAGGAEAVPGWPAWLLPAAGGAPAPAWQYGLAWFLPLLLVSLLAVALAETVFALARKRHVETGWYLPAWLFALLSPAGVSLPHAALAIALGVVVGRLVFGGPGKYLVSPALLGALFLYSGYPEAFRGIPAGQSTWGLWVEGGLPALQAAGITWPAAFLGQGGANIGATSALACLAAALYLAGSGVVSWRTLAGGLFGLALAAAGLAQIASTDPALTAPWYWHASMGGFAFGLVFLAADPGCAPLTTGGRWFLGLAAGALTVLIRALDPAHPDGVLHAVLLAALFAPLADAWVVRRAIARRRRRVETWP